MPYLLHAAFWVGVVGTVVAAPLLCILRLEGSYLDLTRGWSGSWPRFIESFAIVFVIAGWIPLGGGWFAGWLVSKLPDTPAEEAT